MIQWAGANALHVGALGSIPICNMVSQKLLEVTPEHQARDSS